MAIIKDLQQNWLVITFVIVQAIFVVGAKSAQIEKAREEIEAVKAETRSDHELLIELSTDVKWIKKELQNAQRD